MKLRRSRRHLKTYTMDCSCCGVVLNVEETSLVRARLWACTIGWGTTSMDSITAKFVCAKCFPKHRTYEPGRPFLQSAFTELAKLTRKGMSVKERVRRMVWGEDA